MRNTKKWGIFLIPLLVASVVLSACGSKDHLNNGASPSTDSSTANSGQSGQIVELTYWAPSWNEPFAPDIIKEFEEQNPGIKVNVEYFPSEGMNEKYLLALMNKTGPDIMDIAVDWTTPFASSGGLLVLDDYIARDNVDLDDFWPGALKTIRVDGKVYALPYRSETHGLFYNKTLFEQAGLDPDGPKTWDDFLNAAQKITENGGIGFAMVGKLSGDLSYQLINFIRSFGGDVLNEDNTRSLFDQPEAIKAVQFYVDMYKNKLTPDSTLSNVNTDNRNLFVSGNVGMFLSGVYDVDPIIQANPAFEFGAAMYPYTPNIDRKLTLGGWNIVATSYTKYPEEAWKFINFIASPEISVRYSNTFSARKSSIDNPKYQDELIRPFVNMLEYGIPMPPVPQITQIRDILSNQVQQAMLGQVTVEEAMKAAAAEVNALLQQ
jgi:multiple sugar transport system substrate-binding protein